LHNNPNSPIADQLRFKRSENLFQQGMAQDALTGFEAFLQSNKSPQLIPQATFYSGACHILLNNTVRGEQLLKNVLSSYPNDPAATDAARDLGGLFLNNSRYAEAFDMYKRLEAYGASEPDVIPEALLGQGFALLAQDNTDSGKAILNRIISTYPQTDEARQAQLRLGNLYLQHNQITEAMDMFKRLGASGSDSFAAEAQFRYGTLLLQQNKAQDALTIFNTIPTRFPDELDWIAQGYLGKARAHKLLGQRSQAIQAYDKVINEFGDTPFADIARAEKSKV
jgi:TolA-binding protein